MLQLSGLHLLRFVLRLCAQRFLVLVQYSTVRSGSSTALTLGKAARPHQTALRLEATTATFEGNTQGSLSTSRRSTARLEQHDAP